MLNISKTVVLLSITGLCICGTSNAKPGRKYPKNLFALTTLHFDATREAHGLDWYAQSNEGKAILGSIATSLGAAPAYVAVVKAAIPPARVVEEETHYVLPLAKGYSPCAAKITVHSINPPDDPRSPTVNAAINQKEIQMTTWTPSESFSTGRSWARGDIVFYGIKAKYLKEFIRKGVCRKVDAQQGFASCRGRGGCGAPITFGNPAAAASTTPSITRKSK